jgi:hypothetical protein
VAGWIDRYDASGALPYPVYELHVTGMFNREQIYEVVYHRFVMSPYFHAEIVNKNFRPTNGSPFPGVHSLPSKSLEDLRSKTWGLKGQYESVL